jgi:hypothetical protein
MRNKNLFFFFFIVTKFSKKYQSGILNVESKAYEILTILRYRKIKNHRQNNQLILVKPDLTVGKKIYIYF